MNSLTNFTAFSNPEFGEIRTVEIDGEPWFVGKDVAESLGYGNTRDALAAHVDEEDKAVIQKSEIATLEIPNRGLTVINESGLYSLVLSSNLPNAKQFKHWITAEVLPSIRKHGAYMTPETLEKALLNPDGMIKVLQALKEEQEKNKALAAENDRMKPKEIFADAVSSSHSTILIRDLAKLLRQNGVKIGEKRLYQWMRDNGYIIKNSCQPTQRAMEMGLFEVIERTVVRGAENPFVTSTTKVTGKGQQYFVNKLLCAH